MKHKWEQIKTRFDSIDNCYICSNCNLAMINYKRGNQMINNQIVLCEYTCITTNLINKIETKHSNMHLHKS